MKKRKEMGIIKKIAAEYREMGGDKETDELKMMAPVPADWDSSETPREFLPRSSEPIITTIKFSRRENMYGLKNKTYWESDRPTSY